MPYFVYAVRPFAQLERLGAHASFGDASVHVKSLRKANPDDPPTRYRVMFADDAVAAEDLLLASREPRPHGDD